MAVLERAQAAGIELWVEGRRLRFRAPPGALTPALRATLGEERDRLVALLRSRAALEMDVVPVGENQKGLWLLSRMDPDSAAYHVAVAMRVDGTLVPALLEEALQIVVDRHDALRASYVPYDGVPVRVVSGYRPAALDCVDASTWTEEMLHAAIVQDYARPIDIERGPLFCATLYATSASKHVLLLVIHHLAVDGISLLIVVEELLKVYAALLESVAIPASESAATYSEFVEWQRDTIARSAEQRAYWTAVLTPLPPSLALPSDRPRPRLPAMRGATVWRSLDATVAARLRALAREEGVTDYVLLLSLWFVLLRRLSGQDDITVGTPSTGRSAARFARTVGDLINVLPLRMRNIAGLSFRALLHQVRTIALEGLSRQDIPLPTMMATLGAHGEQANGAPFQTLFVLQEFVRDSGMRQMLSAGEGARHSIGSLTLRPYAFDQQQGQSDLSLDVWPSDGGLICCWRFNGDLFDRSTVERWTETFATLMQTILADPAASIDAIAAISAHDAVQLDAWNATDHAYPGDTAVQALVAAQAAQTPHRIAVCAGDGSYTYEALMARAAAIAAELRSMGIQSGDRVGVLLPRGRDLVAALLGVLMSGACYVPLDPRFPVARLRYMLDDAEAAVLLTADAVVDDLGWTGPRLQVASGGGTASGAVVPRLGATVEAGSPAYVIYTSGSTGQPKGVVVSHQSVANLLKSMAQEPGLSANDSVLAVTTVTFDIAALELFLPLTVGARVVVADESDISDGVRLAARLDAEAVTVLQATPATWKLLLDSGWQGKADLRAFCGGEPLSEALAAALLPRVGELWNLYGPTEATIWSTCERVRGGGAVSIGRPIANTTVYVLDPNGLRVPIGVPGELWIGGMGVATGYWKRDALTAERFQASPFRAAERIYRTGDLVRLHGDGRLQHLGRLDHQVKVRGFRIELGEIEARLGEHASVRDTAVVATGESLVAYVVPSAPLPDTRALRDWLRVALPDYMIPSRFIVLEALPRTANGKLDRKALPPAEAAATSATLIEPRSAPKSDVETLVANIWREVLHVSDPSREDSFFSLGGHSLLAVRVVSALRDRMNLDVPVSCVFDRPTLGAFSAEVEAMLVHAGSTSAPTSATRALETLDF
jgi:amino acid adenylation domain-containing protein